MSRFAAETAALVVLAALITLFAEVVGSPNLGTSLGFGALVFAVAVLALIVRPQHR